MHPTNYHANLKAFEVQFASAQRISLDIPDLVVYISTGRKYDRLMVRPDDAHGDAVRYFIDKKTGDIYGPKRLDVPNLKQYYGNIANAHLWDWSGYRGTAISDPTVRLCKTVRRRRATIHHYEPAVDKLSR